MTTLTKDHVKIAKKHGLNRCALKAAEELNELATVLIQTITKKTITNEQITNEIGDVQYRLNLLKHYFNEEDIDKREKYKLEKSLSNLKK